MLSTPITKKTHTNSTTFQSPFPSPSQNLATTKTTRIAFTYISQSSAFPSNGTSSPSPATPNWQSNHKKNVNIKQGKENNQSVLINKHPSTPQLQKSTQKAVAPSQSSITRPTQIISLSEHKDFALNSLLQLEKKLTNPSGLSAFEKEAICNIRKKIEKIEKDSDLSLENKLAELSTLAFFLNNKHEIPVITGKESYLDLRMAQLTKKANQYVKKGKGLKDLSDGSGRYFMRGCVRMILQTGPSLHIGGCHAVKLLLEKASVSEMIANENLEQFLTVIEKLQKDEDFRKLFLKTYKILPGVTKEIVRLDLTLSKAEPINELHIATDLLFSISSIVAQLDEGNCYEIAPFNAFLRHNLELIVKQAISIIEHGSIVYDGITFPIQLFLQSRCTDEADLNIVINPEDSIEAHQVIRTAGALLHKKSLKPIDDEQTIQDYLKQEFQPQDFRTATKIIGSFNRNYLQLALESSLRFHMMNALNASIIGSYSIREWTLDKILDHFLKNHDLEKQHLRKLHSKIRQKFKEKFKSQLERSFYLISYKSNELKLDVEGKKFVFPYHTQGLWHKDNYDYKPALENSRLFVQLNGELIPVDSISDFGKYFAKIVEQTEKEMHKSIGETSVYRLFLNSYVQEILNFLQTPNFPKECAKMLTNINRFQTFDADVYEKADSFFIFSEGGHELTAVGWSADARNFPKSLSITPKNKNIKSLIFSTMVAFKTVYSKKPEYSQNLAPILVMAIPKHAFTGAPHLTKDIWGCSDEECFIKLKNFNKQAIDLLKSTEQDKKDDLLFLLFYKTNNFDLLLEEIRQSDQFSSGSLREFREYLKIKLPEELKNNLDEKFNRVMIQKSTEILLQDIEKIFEEASFLPKEKTAKCIGLAKEALENGYADYSPHEFAQEMRKVFYAAEIGNVHPQQFINIFCDYYKIPRFMDFGLTNWVDHKKGPDFQHLNFGYDFFNEEWTIYQSSNRKFQKMDSELKDEFLSHLAIYY